MRGKGLNNLSSLIRSAFPCENGECANLPMRIPVSTNTCDEL